MQYYSITIEHFPKNIKTPIRKISTEEICNYLVGYPKINDRSKVTFDNIRRNISSFFSWLKEDTIKDRQMPAKEQLDEVSATAKKEIRSDEDPPGSSSEKYKAFKYSITQRNRRKDA